MLLSVAASIACSDDLPVVARGRYVEIATDRADAPCRGTVAHLDELVERGFDALGATPPDRVFVRYEWLDDAFDPEDEDGSHAILERGSRADDAVVRIRTSVAVHRHEMAHAVHLIAWEPSASFLYEGLATVFDAGGARQQQGWNPDIRMDAVVGAETLPGEYYPAAWFLVSQIIRDHGFDGLESLWSAIEPGDSAASVRAAYEQQFGAPLEALLEPITTGAFVEERQTCSYTLCDASGPPRLDAPQTCEDEDAIGPTASHSTIPRAWAVSVIELEERHYAFESQRGAVGTLSPCGLECRALGAWPPYETQPNASIEVQILGGTYSLEVSRRVDGTTEGEPPEVRLVPLAD
jgi:hypothetical protein